MRGNPGLWIKHGVEHVLYIDDDRDILWSTIAEEGNITAKHCECANDFSVLYFQQLILGAEMLYAVGNVSHRLLNLVNLCCERLDDLLRTLLQFVFYVFA